MEETKIAGWGTEIPHALEQLDCAPQLENLHATTAEAHMLWSLSAASAEPTRKSLNSARKILHAATKIPSAVNKTRCSQINK